MSGLSSTTSRTRKRKSVVSGTTIRSKRGITLNLDTADGRQLFATLGGASGCYFLETFPPGFLVSLGLGYESLCKQNPRLIMLCPDSLRPRPAPGGRLSLQRSAAHGSGLARWPLPGMTRRTCRMRRRSLPGGGNAWHMGLFILPTWRLWPLWSTEQSSDQGQYIDASIHEACALTTEAAIANYLYRGEVLRRPRPAAIMQLVPTTPYPVPRQGRQVCPAALVAGSA